MSSPFSPWTKRLANFHPLAILLLGVAIALLAVDALYHKHGHFSVEERFGFYPAVGLLSLILFVLLARVLRPLLERKVTYYDE